MSKQKKIIKITKIQGHFLPPNFQVVQTNALEKAAVRMEHVAASMDGPEKAVTKVF